MHEMTIAQSLLAAISTEAQKQNGKAIGAKISCGLLNAVNDELLCSAFEVIAKDTICEGMELEIEHKPMQGKCKNCDTVFEIKLSNPRCSKCDSEDFELLADAPLVLEEIEF